MSGNLHVFIQEHIVQGWWKKRQRPVLVNSWESFYVRFTQKDLLRLAKQGRELGMGFGLWVEPEMASEDSGLYKAHPDWILGRHEQAIGRTQYVLNLSRPEVQDYLTAVLTKVFKEAKPAYVKWDMNRIMTDAYSSALPPERQGEVRHRYILGLYRVLDALTARFPKILFESCTSGGNRTDPGHGRFWQQDVCADGGE